MASNSWSQQRCAQGQRAVAQCIPSLVDLLRDTCSKIKAQRLLFLAVEGWVIIFIMAHKCLGLVFLMIPSAIRAVY